MHSIGSFCSIGIEQRLVQNGHNINYVSTYGVFLDYKKDMSDADRSIRIGNDVWIGAHSIIRSGVTIGDGAVIGAGSVITKNVAPYTVVVGGNRVIKQRFSDNIVESLLSMKWWEWDDDKIFESMKYWNNVEDFIKRYQVF
jgi:Acetyltransferase (isoleucine patch superfamily)